MQSRKNSLIETSANIASGFVVSYLVMQFIVCPLFGIQVSSSDNFAITVIFTVASFIRSYFWRRFFTRLE